MEQVEMAHRKTKGSGLSLERFIQGKAHKTKAEAKSKKKVIIRKALRKREYEKIKKREARPASEQVRTDGEAASSSSSFYDRFFSELNAEGSDDLKKKGGKEHMDIKPDPFYKAKKKAEMTKIERQRAIEEKQKQKAETEKKVNERKKRHVKLSVRTATGQPVVRNHIKDILAKLQAEKSSA